MSKFFLSKIGEKVLLAILIFNLTGCGVRPILEGQIQAPQVALQEVKIHPPASGCWPISLVLRLTNPNPEPLRLLGYDYEVRIDGREVVQGESQGRLTLPAKGETVLEVPVLLNLETVPQTLTVLLRQPKVPYEFLGGIRLASVLGGLRVPFRFRGEFTQEEGWRYLRDYLAR